MRIKPDAFQGSGRYMADCRNMKWAKVHWKNYDKVWF